MLNIATNKKATHNFIINEKYDVGLVLTGAEVKSLRVNTGSIKESYIVVKDGELWLRRKQQGVACPAAKAQGGCRLWRSRRHPVLCRLH